jgi:hypothetical protein
MSIGRKVLVLAFAVAFPVSLVTLVGAGSASAKSPGFSGNAVGKVTCTAITVKVKFNPPFLPTVFASPVHLTITGKLSQCTVSNTPAGVTETITQGKITGSSTGTNIPCPPTNSNSDVNLNIVWKGKYTDATHSGKPSFTNSTVTDKGYQAVTDNQANFGLELPVPPGNGSTVSGSFAGPVTDESFLYTSQSSTAIQNLCSSPLHGLKKLSLTHGVVGYP